MTAAALPLPDPALAGAGFELRPWVPADAPALAAAWRDPEVARWTGVPSSPDERAAGRWIEGDAARRQRGLSLDLVIDVAGEVAGEVGLAGFDGRARSADIGWWVAPAHRRRRLASAAARALAGWATEELALEVLLARCHRDNPGSVGVARVAGFAPPEAVTGDELVWCFPAVAGGTVPT